jgi:hypothetical protein
MVNYGKTKIYKIWSPLGDNIYIGSTTKDYLCKRMDQHRHEYKKYLKNNKTIMNYTSILIFDEYGINNCYIELIEAKECTTKDEQTKLEGGYIRKLKCVNKYIPDRTKKEHYEDNKDVIIMKQKQYYEKNKEKILLRHNEKFTCVCGSHYIMCHKKRHEKTTKHLNFINHPNQ